MKGVFSEFAEEGLNMQWTDECFDEIKKGDKVWYENPQGQVHTAKTVMRGPHGWVCDRGNGQPVVVNEGHNFLGFKPGKSRKSDHLGDFLYG